MHPVANKPITTEFHKSGSMWSLGWHTGVDYACDKMTDVLAPAPGYVARVAWDNSYGNYILLRCTLYGVPYNIFLCHLTTALVSAGDVVKMGQHIGESGLTGNVTGPHVHFEVRKSPYGFNGTDIVDPKVAYQYSGAVAVDPTKPTVFDICVWNIARERWYTEWDTRKAEIQRELYEEASVYCFQELFEAEAINTIKAALPKCKQFTGPAGLEFFYDGEKWKFISGENLYSGIARRYMQHVILERISTGQRVDFFNVHAPIEAEGATAKERYAAWAVPKVKAAVNPAVVAGDFNASESYSPKKEFRAAGFISFKEQAAITNESVKEFIPSSKDLCDIRTQPAGPADIIGGEVDVSTTSLESDHRREEARVVIAPKAPEPVPVPPTTPSIPLEMFKWTLPTGEDEHPDEVFPIGHFQIVPHFVQLSNGHIRARAHCGGVTTSGSSYARSEGREMAGTAKAAWDSDDGDNHLFWGRSAVLMLPPNKRKLVLAQTHDPDDDIVMLLASGFEDEDYYDLYLSKSLGKGLGSDLILIHSHLLFGEFFDWRIDFNEAGCSVAFEGERLPTIEGVWHDCYNKWGTYVQANTETDAASSYGETEHALIGVKHG